MRGECPTGAFVLVRGPFRPFSQVVALWARQDLNLQPTDYESVYLTALTWEIVPICGLCCTSVAHLTTANVGA